MINFNVGFVFLSFLTAVTIVGCSPSSSFGGMASPSTVGQSASKNSAPAKDSTSAVNLVTTRKVITTVFLTMQVKDVENTVQRATDLMQQAGGYVANMNRNSRNASLVLRVPSSSTSGIVGQLKTFGEVQNEQSSGQDVTEDYVDTATRIKSMQVEEQRMLELLKKADKMDDILKIENELARVRLDIEKAQGHMKFLDNKIDFTTIELILSADPTETPKEQAGAMYRAWNGMVGNVKGVYIFFRESFVWIASHLITLLMLALVGYGAYRMRIFRDGGK